MNPACGLLSKIISRLSCRPGSDRDHHGRQILCFLQDGNIDAKSFVRDDIGARQNLAGELNPWLRQAGGKGNGVVGVGETSQKSQHEKNQEFRPHTEPYSVAFGQKLSRNIRTHLINRKGARCQRLATLRAVFWRPPGCVAPKSQNPAARRFFVASRHGGTSCPPENSVPISYLSDGFSWKD